MQPSSVSRKAFRFHDRGLRQNTLLPPGLMRTDSHFRSSVALQFFPGRAFTILQQRQQNSLALAAIGKGTGKSRRDGRSQACFAQTATLRLSTYLRYYA